MKRLYATIFVTILILLIPLTANASINIVIDGESLSCYDSNGSMVEPFVYEGTTYVPVRAIAQAFDISVFWDNDTKTVHLGTVGGTPTLGEQINIFYNGEEFIPRDVNGNSVYPILKEGTTYLPIRGIGTLFDKSIYWDNLAQTAVLTTKASQNAVSYLADSIKNTATLAEVSVNLTATGTAMVNGNTFSQTEKTALVPYSSNGFTLSDLLPENYTENVAYLGGGRYFIAASSIRFISDQQLQEKLAAQLTPTDYSSLYIYVFTRGGYITDINLYFAGKANYGGMVLNQAFSITAALEYPEGFTFPITPYPDRPLSDNEKPVSAATGDKEDVILLNSLVKTYVEYLTGAQAKKLFALMPAEDSTKAFSHKSAAQLTLEQNDIAKNLRNRFEFADGTFTLDALVYTAPEALTYPPDNAARAEISINHFDGEEDWSDTVEVIFIKKKDKWYLDISSVMDLYNY